MNVVNNGSENINIGGSDYSQQSIYINRYLEKNNEIEYSEDLDLIKIGGVEGYKKRVEITAIISLVSAVVTIWQFLSGSGTFFPLILITTICVACYGTSSWFKYKSLKEHGFFESNGKIKLFVQEGEVCTVRKYGTCKICGGRVYIHNYPDSKTKRQFGKCVNNSDHLYTFDPTIDRGELIKLNYLDNF